MHPVCPSLPLPSGVSSSEAESSSLLEQRTSAVAEKVWHEKAIAKIDEYEIYADILIPHITDTNLYKRVSSYVPKQLSAAAESCYAEVESIVTMMRPKLKSALEWLDSNGHDKNDCMEKLVLFLAKLPFRAAKNILLLVCQIVNGAIYAVKHPVKATMQLAKCLVLMLHELTKPETWTKIGVGMMGAAVGQGLAMGNPIAPLALIIGAAFAVAGLTAGVIKAAVLAEKGKGWDSALQNLKQQGIGMPEVFVTGLLMGLIMGGIQKTQYDANTRRFNELMEQNFDNLEPQEYMKFAREYAELHNLPEPSRGWGYWKHYKSFGWGKDSFQAFVGNEKFQQWLRLCAKGWSETVFQSKWVRSFESCNLLYNGESTVFSMQMAPYDAGFSTRDFFNFMRPDGPAYVSHTALSTAGAAVSTPIS